MGWRSRFRIKARRPAVDPFGPTAGAACEPPGEPVDALPRPLARIGSASWTTLDHELTTFIQNGRAGVGTVGESGVHKKRGESLKEAPRQLSPFWPVKFGRIF